jgi:hypothetical protein
MLCYIITLRSKFMKFNYRNASLNEVVKHIVDAKPQAVQASKLHYQRQGASDVVQKITQARLLARCERILRVEA